MWFAHVTKTNVILRLISPKLGQIAQLDFMFCDSHPHQIPPKSSLKQLNINHTCVKKWQNVMTEIEIFCLLVGNGQTKRLLDNAN